MENEFDSTALDAQEARYQEMESEIQSRAADLNLQTALTSTVSPDDVAKTFKKARKFNVPVPLADAITPQEELSKDEKYLAWRDAVNSQPAFKQRMSSDLNFANLVKDDIGNVSSLASVWWKMWGNEAKPDSLWGSFTNSTARGGYALTNTLPGFGAAQEYINSRDEYLKYERWAKQVADGQTPEEWRTEVDPEGRIARSFWEKNGENVLKEYRQRIEDAANTVTWATSMATMFPHSAAMDKLSEAKGFEDSVAAFMESPLQTLADVGPESLVQSAPALAISAVAPGVAAPLLMGTYSMAQDRAASFLSNISDLDIDTTNPKALTEFAMKDTRWGEALDKAERHAAPVGLLDALSFGAAKWVLPKEMGWLKAFSPSSERAYAKFMSAPFKSKMVNLAVQTAVQGTMGGTGEALGQLNADGEITSWADIVAEFAGEAFTSPVEVMSATKSAIGRKMAEVQRAKDFQERVTQQAAAAQQSQTLARDPQTVTDMLNEVNKEREARGEAPATIYFSAEALHQEEAIGDRLTQAAEKARVEMEDPQLAARLAQLRDELTQAVQTGDDVQLSASDYLLLQRIDAELTQRMAAYGHLEGDPTLAEAEAAAADIVNGQTELLSRAMAKETPEFREAVARVGAMIGSTLKDQTSSGVQMPKDEQKAIVTLLETLVANTAKDAGMSPEAVWQTYGFADVLNDGDVTIDENGRLVALTPKAKALFEASNKRGKKRGLVDLNQGVGENLKGSYIAKLRTIIRWGKADRSTFLHETGHLFLDMRVGIALTLKKAASRTESQQRLVDLAEKTVKWLGADSLEAFAALPSEKRRPMHEKFARTYEAYLMEGNAPTTALLGVFRRFTAWLKKIYGALSAIPEAELSDDVRALFDGLFVAQEEEAAARAMRGLYSLADLLHENFSDGSGKAGEKNEEALLAYIQDYFDATQAEAEEQLRAQGFRSMAYIRRLHKAMTKNLQREAERLRMEIAKEELPKILKTKPYGTYDLLRQGVTRSDGSRFTPKLLKSELREAGFTAGQIKLLTDRGLTTASEKAKNYVPGEALAQSEGFTSLSEMVWALLDCDTIEDLLEARVDARMIEEHAELHDDQSIAKAADAAIFNPSAARMLAEEVNYLEKSTGPKRVSAAIFEKIAKVALGGMKWKKVSPSNARKNASELGRQAVRALKGEKRDTAQAADLKRKQLYQTVFAQAADKAKKHLEKVKDALKKEAKSKSMDRDFQIQLQYFLARLGIRDFKGNEALPGQKAEGRTRVPSYEEFQQIAQERGLPTPEMGNVVSSILSQYSDGTTTPFDDLTVDEATQVSDFLSDLAAMGHAARKVTLRGEKVELAQAQGQLAQAVVDHAEKSGRKELELGEKDNDFKKTAGSWLRSFDMLHRRIQSLFTAMEGGHGVIYEYITKRADACATKKEKMLHDLVIPFDAAMRPLWKLAGDMKKTFFPEINASLTKRQLLAALLNCGNEGNFERLLDGSDQYDWTRGSGENGTGPKEKWTREGLLRVIGRVFTAEELDAVQKVWDVIGSQWGEVLALEEREGHRAPDRVDPSPLTISIRNADGSVTLKTLKGGYYPVAYDAELSGSIAQREAEELAKLGLSAARGASKTDQSRIKTRAESGGGRALKLTLSAGFDGLNAVVHDLCWREFVNDANKLMQSDGAFALAIRRYWGAEAERAIRQWIKDIAENGKDTNSASDVIFRAIRRNVSIAGIGLNLVTAAIQPIGIIQSVVTLGAGWTFSGVGKFMQNPIRAMREVEEKSAMMAARSRTRFREVAEIQQRISGPYGRYKDGLMRVAYLPIVAMQALVDVPTWIGAYHKGLSEGMTEEDAIALADRLTIEAQGSGRMSDLSGIERKKGWSQIFTAFYTFFNAAYNIAAVSKSNDSKVEFAWKMALLLGMQPVIETFLREGLKAAVGGDEDDWLEKAAKKAAISPVGFTLNLWVGAREFAEIGNTLAHLGGMPYSGPAGARVISDINRLANQIAQGEIDEGLAKAIISAAGVTTGAFPVVPINRAISGASALANGESDNPLVLLLGAPSK